MKQPQNGSIDHNTQTPDNGLGTVEDGVAGLTPTEYEHSVAELCLKCGTRAATPHDRPDWCIVCAAPITTEVSELEGGDD